MSTLEVNTINPQSGSTITLGSSGNTVALGSGVSGSGFGKIGQVVQGTTTTGVTITSSTYVDTGLSASITPSSTSSKILVMVDQLFYLDSNDGSIENSGRLKILRDSTNIFETPSSSDIRITAEHAPNLELRLGKRMNVIMLDSPSSTSALTYKTQGNKVNGNSVQVNKSGSEAHIILMEVLA